MNTYKTAVLRWGLRLVMFLGLCTVLAGVIRSQLMPQVQAVKPYSGSLSCRNGFLTLKSCFGYATAMRITTG